MSISTTAGSKRAAFSTASRAVARLRDDVDVGLAGEQHAEAGADHRLVVGDEHADGHRPPPSSGKLVLSTKPPPFAGAGGHLATVDLHPLADADQAVAEPVAGRGAAAVVADVDPQLVGAVADDDVGAARVRVLERVRQPLLDDAVGGEVERAAAAAPARRRRCSRTGRPARPNASTQRVEVGEAGLGREVGVRRRRGASRRAGGASPRARRGRCARRRGAPRGPRPLGGQVVPHGADVEHHHAHGVGDDVVQLARDPRALLRDGDARRRLTLALGVRRPLLRRLGLHGALAHGEAGQPRDREQRPG